MELLTISEVAKKLKINVNLVYKLIHHGHMECLKLGAMKVTAYELDRFIKWASGKDFSDLENITDIAS